MKTYKATIRGCKYIVSENIALQWRSLSVAEKRILVGQIEFIDERLKYENRAGYRIAIKELVYASPRHVSTQNIAHREFIKNNIKKIMIGGRKRTVLKTSALKEAMKRGVSLSCVYLKLDTSVIECG